MRLLYIAFLPIITVLHYVTRLERTWICAIQISLDTSIHVLCLCCVVDINYIKHILIHDIAFYVMYLH